MHRHLNGTDGAHDVPTPAFRELDVTAAQVVRLGDVLAVDGPSGAGKTFAVHAFLEGSRLAYVRIQIRNYPRGRMVAWQLHHALTGARASDRVASFMLENETLAALEARPHVVWIDEAQYLGVDGLCQLRYLHDEGDGRWPLFLVGSGVLDHLGAAPELDNRVCGQVRFRKLEGRELIVALHEYHDLFRNADDELLRRWDRAVAHGVFRNWAHTLQLAILLAERLRVNAFNEKIARNVVRAMRGGNATFDEVP